MKKGKGKVSHRANSRKVFRRHIVSRTYSRRLFRVITFSREFSVRKARRCSPAMIWQVVELVSSEISFRTLTQFLASLRGILLQPWAK